MPTHGVEIVVEDDDTDTTFQYKKLVKKMTKGYLKSLQNGKIHFLKDTKTSIGRDSTKDICLNNLLVESDHAVILYCEPVDCFLIEDHNTTHGTYVNDCRIQNASARLAHGDIVRLGHGGPCFEVQLHIQCYPPVVQQQAWNSSRLSESLPYLPLQSSLSQDGFDVSNTATRPYSLIQYGRKNGYHAHNQTTEAQNVRPHPPQRTRPVSANPSNGVFLQSASKPTFATSFAKDSLHKFSAQQQNQKMTDQVVELENRLLKMGDELSRLASYESECSRKDEVIETLRNDIAGLQKEKLTSLSSDSFIQQIASLQSQISTKDQEIKRLQEDIRKMNTDKIDNSNGYTNQLAELKTQLTRHEQELTVMYNDLKKSEKEKSQLTALVTSLQKEATAKDLLVKKGKSEIEKLRVTLRNKENELATISAKLAKHTVIRDAEKNLKRKEEELSRLKHKHRLAETKLQGIETRLEENEAKLQEKEIINQSLEESINKLKNTITDKDQGDRKKNLELDIANAKYRESEASNQSLKIQLENFERKHNNLIEEISNFLGTEGVVLTSEDSLTIIAHLNDIKNQRDYATDRLDQVISEKVEIENFKLDPGDMEEFEKKLMEINERLSVNGRTCQSLKNELNLVEGYEPIHQLKWVKNCVARFLSSEHSWEETIESSLESIRHDEECLNDNPSDLIHKLHEKLRDNSSKITDLELKINDSEKEHSKLYGDIKDKIKDKYKKKTEKALKEQKQQDEKFHEREINNLKEELEGRINKMKGEYEKRLRRALDEQKSDFEKDMEQTALLAKKLKIIKEEHKTAREEFLKLKEELEKSKLSESYLRDQLQEKDQRSKIREEILEQKLKDDKECEISYLQNKIKEQQLKVITLENGIIDTNREKKELELQVFELEKNIADRKFDSKKIIKDQEVKKSLLQDENKELKDMNLLLNEQLNRSKSESGELQEVIKTLKKDLNGMTAKLSDLKGEISDKEKEKVENMTEVIEKQKEELAEQRRQLLELSTLLDEQKSKLIEQDQKIVKQNNALAFHAESAVTRSSHVEKQKEHDIDEDEQLPLSMSLENIAERCLAKRHEQIIKKQKLALADLRNMVTALEHLKPPVPSHDLALIQISNLKKEIDILRHKLATKAEIIMRADDQLQDEVLRSQELLKSTHHEYVIESQTHKQTQEALHTSEEIYLKLLRTVSEILEIHHVLGCKPLGLASSEGRAAIVMERKKAMENILTRIEKLQSRLDRKDQLLQGYDCDLKNLRQAEVLASKKSAESKDLEKQLNSHKDEIGYLQEALKKCRYELDEQRRLNTSLKQKKVFTMDYKEVSPPKPHNCYVDEQTKHKEEVKLKRKDELLKKRRLEIEQLREELGNAQRELVNAKNQITSLQMSQECSPKTEEATAWLTTEPKHIAHEEQPVRDTDSVDLEADFIAE